MKKPPSKQDIRRRLESQTRSYLDRGGEIRAVPQGVSAVDEAISPIKTPIFTGKPEQRTPGDDEDEEQGSGRSQTQHEVAHGLDVELDAQFLSDRSAGQVNKAEDREGDEEAS